MLSKCVTIGTQSFTITNNSEELSRSRFKRIQYLLISILQLVTCIQETQSWLTTMSHFCSLELTKTLHKLEIGESIMRTDTTIKTINGLPVVLSKLPATFSRSIYFGKCMEWLFSIANGWWMILQHYFKNSEIISPYLKIKR